MTVEKAITYALYPAALMIVGAVRVIMWSNRWLWAWVGVLWAMTYSGEAFDGAFREMRKWMKRNGYRI